MEPTHWQQIFAEQKSGCQFLNIFCQIFWRQKANGWTSNQIKMMLACWWRPSKTFLSAFLDGAVLQIVQWTFPSTGKMLSEFYTHIRLALSVYRKNLQAKDLHFRVVHSPRWRTFCPEVAATLYRKKEQSSCTFSPPPISSRAAWSLITAGRWIQEVVNLIRS